MKLTKVITYSDTVAECAIISESLYHSEVFESEKVRLYIDTDWEAVIGLDHSYPEEWDLNHDYHLRDTVWRAYFAQTFDDGTYLSYQLIEEVIESEIVMKWKEDHDGYKKIIKKLKENSYSETEYGVDEFDANDVIRLSDAIEIIDMYLSGSEEV